MSCNPLIQIPLAKLLFLLLTQWILSVLLLSHTILSQLYGFSIENLPTGFEVLINENAVPLPLLTQKAI